MSLHEESSLVFTRWSRYIILALEMRKMHSQRGRGLPKITQAVPVLGFSSGLSDPTTPLGKTRDPPLSLSACRFLYKPSSTLPCPSHLLLWAFSKFPLSGSLNISITSPISLSSPELWSGLFYMASLPPVLPLPSLRSPQFCQISFWQKGDRRLTRLSRGEMATLQSLLVEFLPHLVWPTSQPHCPPLIPQVYTTANLFKLLSYNSLQALCFSLLFAFDHAVLSHNNVCASLLLWRTLTHP